MYADDDEIVALLEVVREHGGYYTPHHRNYADVTCIDAETIRDTATYEDPRRQPEGVPYVLVNGVVVVDDGRHTGALAGRALRASGRGARRLPALG